jgi:hypothetical protein
MNLSRPLLAPTNLLHSIGLKSRRLLPRQQCHTFGPLTESERHGLNESMSSILIVNKTAGPR